MKSCLNRARFFQIMMIGILLRCPVLPVFAAGGEDVEFFEHEKQVVTASRRLQPVREAPVAVEVITKEDIRAAGPTNIWDLLRFRVGMDVMDGRSSDGNRAIVSVRGFPQEYVNDLQVLLDGHSVFSGSSGGVFWSQLPVQLQDIERIEIVRGPNAALYGSNAGLGVVNIITRKPEVKNALSFNGLGGSLGAGQGGAAYETTLERFAYRISYTYVHQDGFPGDPAAAVAAKDYLDSQKAFVRGEWQPSDRTRLSLSAGGSFNRQGLEYDRDGNFRQGLGMLKFAQDLGDSSIEVLASRNVFEQIADAAASGQHGAVGIFYYQDDFEFQHQINWLDSRLKTTWGASYRNIEAKSDQEYAGNPDQKNPVVRGFVHQSVGILDQLTLVGAAALERSDTGGTQPAYQLAGIYFPTKDDALRLSYSFAPTLPNLYETHANQNSEPGIFIAGNPDLKPQKLSSYEIGYQGTSLHKRLQVEMNLFYMQITDLSSSVVSSISFFPSFQMNLSFANNNEAIARGAEAKVAYRFSPGRLAYVNYTYEDISDQLGDPLVTFATPKHKVNLGGTAALGHGFSGTVNIGHKTGYFITNFSGATADIPAYWRVDVRLAYSPVSNLEFFVAGKNLIDPTHPEFPDGLDVPRVYYGGLSSSF